MNQIKIEQGIPIPEKSKQAFYKKLLPTLKTGECFMVDDGLERQSVLMTGKRLGIPLVSRKIPEKGFRIWRA